MYLIVKPLPKAGLDSYGDSVIILNLILSVRSDANRSGIAPMSSPFPPIIKICNLVNLHQGSSASQSGWSVGLGPQ